MDKKYKVKWKRKKEIYKGERVEWRETEKVRRSKRKTEKESN